jgi:uncharacterized protein DUF4166
MQPAGDEGLYPDLLGPAWAALPRVVQKLHLEGRAQGALTIEGGGPALARWLARLLGFPPSGENVPTFLTVERHGRGQLWSRRFGGYTMTSRQRRLAGSLMAERLGSFECRFRLRPTPRGIDYEPVGAALVAGPLRLPLPRFLAPRVTATTWADNERMGLDVSVSAPLVGQVLRYHGFVTPEAEGAGS